MSGRNRLRVLLAGIAVLLITSATPARANPIAQVGCVDPGGAGGCALPTGARAIAIAPDGLKAYVAQPAVGRIAVFDVNPSTGALTRDDDLTGKGLVNVVDIAISANGQWLVAASNGTPARTANDLPLWDSGIALFKRNSATGDFEFASCLTQHGDTDCGTGTGLGAVLDVEIDATGRDVYALSWVAGDADRGYLAVLRTDAPGFRQTGCFATAGGHVPSCTSVNALTGPTALALAPNEKHVYAATWRQESIATFDRAASDGSLTTSTCVAASLIGCSPIDFLDAPGETSSSGPSALAFGDDSRLYVATRPGRTVGLLDRDPSTGALTRHPGAAGCVTSQAALVPACTAARRVSTTAMPEEGSLWETQTIAAHGSTLVAGAIDAARDDALDNTALTSYDVGSGGAIFPIGGPFGCTAPTVALDCTAGAGFGTTGLGPVSLAFSPDGRFVYAALTKPFDYDVPGAILVFKVDEDDEFAPVCQDRSVTTPANTAVTVALQCSDAEGDPLTLQIAGGPANGSVGAVDSAARTVAYTPPPGFSGQTTFTYTAMGPTRKSAPATVTITVQAPPGGGSGGSGGSGDGTGGGGSGVGGGSPPPDPPKRLSATVKPRWVKARSRVILRRLRIVEVPTGARVEVRCDGKRCPFKTKRFAVRKGKVDASSAVKKGRLRARATIQVWITKTGATGMVVIYEVPRRGLPKGEVRCVPPGASAPASC